MLDKSAITKAAQKFAARGQIDKAIAKWEKLLEESQDGNIYNIVGDLYLKKKAKHEAIEAFIKAANIFREDGFYLKAMALYKKILHISPSEIEALVPLAELNAEKGLLGNANDNFFAAAELYIKEGTTEKALELYKKLIKLTPHNIELKIKMAELYLKIGLKEEAIKEYLSIASGYLEKAEHEKAQEFYLRVIGLDQQNVASYVGLSKIAENENNIKQAYEYLNNVISFAPDNSDVLFNYARVAINTNSLDNAKQALTKLIEIDPSNNQYKKLLGSIYLKEGLLEKAWKELLPYIDEVLHLKRWSEALELLNNFNEIDPITVKRHLITIYKGKDDKKAAISELRELAGIFDSKELFQDALQSYKELLELNPSDEAARDRIKELEEHVEDVPPKDDVLIEKGAAPSAKELSKSLEEKLTEADFYAQHGLKDEAIKLYKKLLSISPDNKEVIKRLEALELEIEVSGRPAEKPKDKPSEAPEEKDEYETHYNLGIAYKEMGMLEDAIKEFQIAANDPKRTVQSTNMLALCYMDKKSYPLAIKEFKRALEAMAPTDDGYLEIKFDLANANVKNKDYNNALKLYMEIYAQDPSFKDVTHKVEILKKLMLKTKDKPKSKKDRVSYI